MLRASSEEAGMFTEGGEGMGVRSCMLPSMQPHAHKPNSLPVDFSPFWPIPEFRKGVEVRERNPSSFPKYPAQLKPKKGTGLKPEWVVHRDAEQSWKSRAASS